MGFIYDIFINLCLLLDGMLMGVNSLLFELFMEVANARVSDNVFSTFINNIYIVIGIFMIFRVAFSLIQMLANPDMIADKEKGAGKLASRIVIVFGLIILTPTIFNWAYNLQAAVLGENILGRIIMGDGGSNYGNADMIKDQGDRLSLRIFKGMITITDGIKESPDVQSCIAALDDDNTYDSIDSLRYVGNSGGFDCFTDDVNGKVAYDYKFLVSTIALGMVAWLLVGYCIDIGTRLIKLAFLQLIAPVCMVTYIGGGKENSFGKWTKMTISTYVSVFVKLITIYFIIFLASNLNMDELGIKSSLAYVAVILGLLVFAKNAPKLIGDLFGVQMDQESGFKGIAKTALLGGAAMAASGGLAGMSNLAKGIGNTKDAFKDAKGFKGKLGALAGGIGGTALSTLGGGASGAFHGAKNGFGKNATLSGSINKALMASRTARDNRADRTATYGGPGKALIHNISDRILGFAGLDTQAKAIVNQRKGIGAGLNRAKSNLLHQQNLYAEQHNIDVGALDKYTYDANAKKWFEFDGKNLTETDISSLNGYDQGYLDFVQRDSELELRIAKNASLQGKAETQKSIVEGSNGKSS